MKRLFKTCAAAAVMALLGFASFSAQAITTGYTTVLFSGNCIDCAEAAGTDSYSVTATLVLQGENFFQNEKLNEIQFVSFSYSGSNLFDAYEITKADGAYFSAQFNSFIFIEKDLNDGTNLFFTYIPYARIDANGDWIDDFSGRWATGIDSYEADYGDGGTWQVVGADNNVPEPATSLMFGAALVGLGLSRRRRV